jgi:integrase
MGVSVREKVSGSGAWWIFIRHKGKRASHLAKGANYEAALRVKEDIERDIRIGKFDIDAMISARAPEVAKEEKPKVQTLDEYYKRFEKVYLSTSVRQGTSERYATSFKHILPELGSLPMNEITRERIKDFVAHLVAKRHTRHVKVKTYADPTKKRKPTITMKAIEAPLSKTSIHIILAQLCSVMSHAVEENVITVNPATKLGKFYKQTKVVHEEIQPLTAEEVPVFLSAVLARPASKDYFPIFLLAIHSGLRAGELIGLQWGDIDFRGKFLSVKRTFTRGRVEGTKTGKHRRVDMSDAVLQELTALKKKRYEEQLALGSNEIPQWVFCNREGNPLEYYNLKHRHFEKCLEAAKLRRIRFHDLRHTFASLLIQNGESLAYVKDQLGHSSIKMTVDVYGHLVPGANRAAVNRLPSLDLTKAKAQAAG